MIVYDTETAEYHYSFSRVPEWLRSAWTPSAQKFGQAEIAAAILPYFSLPNRLIRNRRVIHFVDNFRALSSIFNGYSRAPDSAWMVNLFHTANTRIRAHVWWEHVDSKANCSDMPSRMNFDLVHELGATYFELMLDEYMWMRPSTYGYTDEPSLSRASARAAPRALPAWSFGAPGNPPPSLADQP